MNEFIQTFENLLKNPEQLLEVAPTLLTCIFCLISLIIVSGYKFSLLRTLLILTPYTLLVIGLNAYIFIPLGNGVFEDYYVLSVFIPFALILGILGKRRGISLITGIVNAYIGFYLIFLIKNVFTNWVKETIVLQFIIYFGCFPLVLLYLKFFYNRLHNLIETFLRKYLWLLLLYGLAMFAEIYLYQFLIKETTEHVLRLEIFGIAILSVYFISIVGFYIILRQYRKKTYELNDKSVLEKQVELIIEQYKVKELKEKELRILRHDMKHVLITTSSLIQKEKNKEALDFIKKYVENIESTAIKKYCKDPIIDAVLGYYRKKCDANNIKFKTKINNFEEILKISSYDMAILISNCLENAINASLRLNSNRIIDFIFLNNSGRLVLLIKNKYDGEITFDNENMPTNPLEDHGIGTKSIEDFAKRNDLILNYNITKTTFEISILFKE